MSKLKYIWQDITLFSIFIGSKNDVILRSRLYKWKTCCPFQGQITTSEFIPNFKKEFASTAAIRISVKIKDLTRWRVFCAGRPLGRYYRPLVDNRPFCIIGGYFWICGRYYIKMVDISSKYSRSCYAFCITAISCCCPNQKNKQIICFLKFINHNNLMNKRLCGQYLVDITRFWGQYLVIFEIAVMPFV